MFVTVSISLKVTPESVFDAFADPILLGKWMYQAWSLADVRELFPRVEGTIRVDLKWASGWCLSLSGRFIEIRRPNLLKFSWGVIGDPVNQGIVTVQIAPESEGSVLTLIHEGLPAEAQEHSKAGWTAWFENLRKLLESV